MTARLLIVRSFLSFMLLLMLAAPSQGQPATAPVQSDALVAQVLAVEVRTAQDTQHPMR